MKGGLDQVKSLRRALILVDVINHFDFVDGDKLLRNALRISATLRRLKLKARRANWPTIYVNDNFGEWRSNYDRLVQMCTRPDCPGRAMVQALQPDEEDYLLLKPMHSGFYQTSLETLLRTLKIRCVVLCGLATNSCILATAQDARMRDLEVLVVSDACAARSMREHRNALELIEFTAAARCVKASELRF
jgi:nicotinamidase-related amidase